MHRYAAALILSSIALAPLPATARCSPPPGKRVTDCPRTPTDPAIIAAGTYVGEILIGPASSSRGKTHVTLERIELNTVRVTTDDPVVRAFTAKVERIEGRITGADGPNTLSIDLSSYPATLEIHIGELLWRGTLEIPVRPPQ